MAIGLFARAVIIGFSIAATVGPMSVLCMRRAAHRGFLYGWVSGLGVATADGIYASVASFGITAIAHFLIGQQLWIRLVGSAFLIYLGVTIFISKPAEREAGARANTYIEAYVSTLLLTLTNPLTILSFIAIFAGIGLGGGHGGAGLATLTVAGVFAGSATWWTLLTRIVSLARGKLTPARLRWLNRVSGAAIALLGLLAALSAL